MTKNEMIAVLERLEEYYRNFYSGIEKERVFNSWYPMFRDDPAGLVNRAVMVYICTEKFAPTVSGIKMAMAEITMAGQMTEIQAWQKIREAIDNATSRSEARTQYAGLSPLLQKLVGSPTQLVSWRRVSEDTLEGVIASNVQRSYRELARREAVYYAIPGQLQAEQTWRIEGPKEELSLPGLVEPKTVDQILDEANRAAAEHGMTMTDDLKRKNAARVDAFLKPVTKAEEKALEFRDQQRIERMFR